MLQYKIVEGPRNLYISHTGTVEKALNEFSSIIQRETRGGWELVFIYPITATIEAAPVGCLGGILAAIGLVPGPASETVNINMLVFAKGQTIKSGDMPMNVDTNGQNLHELSSETKTVYSPPSQSLSHRVSTLANKTSDGGWICRYCGTKNKSNAQFCKDCAKYK